MKTAPAALARNASRGALIQAVRIVLICGGEQDGHHVVRSEHDTITGIDRAGARHQ